MSELWPEPLVTAALSVSAGGLFFAMAYWFGRNSLVVGVAGILITFVGLALVCNQPTLAWAPAAALALSPAVFSAVSWIRDTLSRRLNSNRLKFMGYACVGPVLILCVLVQCELGSTDDVPPSPEGPAAAEVEWSAATAWTDKGRQIRLGSAKSQDQLAGLARAEQGTATAHSFSLIRTGPVDLSCNCHGWVLTGGRYWIHNEAIELILADNGYETVNEPKAGDLAIYREGDKSFTHTGIVRFADSDSTLIESKWGAAGRFLHPPKNQPYGGVVNYFRSSRNGHVLLLTNKAADNSGESKTPSASAILFSDIHDD